MQEGMGPVPVRCGSHFLIRKRRIIYAGGASAPK